MSKKPVSISKLVTMDKQDIFDLIVPALLKQGTPCKLNGVCVYDNGKGLRCAVGLALDDTSHEYIKQNFLHRSTFTSVADHASSGGAEINDAIDFIGVLQDMHDSYVGDEFVDFVRTRARYIASINNLNTNALDG